MFPLADVCSLCYFWQVQILLNPPVYLQFFSHQASNIPPKTGKSMMTLCWYPQLVQQHDHKLRIFFLAKLYSPGRSGARALPSDTGWQQALRVRCWCREQCCQARSPPATPPCCTGATGANSAPEHASPVLPPSDLSPPPQEHRAVRRLHTEVPQGYFPLGAAGAGDRVVPGIQPRICSGLLRYLQAPKLPLSISH